MISFFKQDVNKVLFKNALNNFKNDLWVNGKIVHKFENNLKKSLKIQHYVSSCNSGSDALLLSLLMDKNNKKDIYITTPISYLASSSIPRFLGLNLIYIDVEEDGYTMCLEKLEYFLKNCPIKIKRRLKGIINVELFGTTCDLIKLRKISFKNNLSLIGDCAQSLGTKFRNKSTISYYDFSFTSFYPTKVLSCYGDGGAVFSKKNVKKLYLLKNNGHSFDDKSTCKELGINSRLDSIQAYILNSKLKKLNKIIILKRKFHEILRKYIKDKYNFPKSKKEIKSNSYVFPMRVPSKSRSKFIKYMKLNNVECKVFYSKIIPDNKLLKPIVKTNLKNAKKLTKTLVCVPSHSELKIKDIHKIGALIKKFNF